MGPFPITSERLQLREFRLEDQRAIHEYASDPEVTMHTGWGPNDEETTRTVLQQWIIDQQAWPRNSIPLGIELRSAKKLIGSTGFSSIDNATGVFGFVLHKNFWGHGFATEACRALLGFGFNDLHLHRVTAECFVEQARSVRIMEKLGMRREGHCLKNAWKAGVWRDTYTYALLDTEWKARCRS
jgi:[ribosomal protein S5]-alanine N-acetyltransferase